MIVLGIDPGTTRAGYGVVEKKQGRIVYLASGLLSSPNTKDQGGRLLALERGLQSIIGDVRPEVAGMERLYLAKNKKTAVRVAEARGVIIKILSEKGVPLEEFSPPSVKLAVTGSGVADKKAVAKMVSLILNIDTSKMLDDVTDALAIAIAASSTHHQP